jgi:hypothetical protein
VLHRSGRATARIQVAAHIMCGCALPHPPILHSCVWDAKGHVEAQPDPEGDLNWETELRRSVPCGSC